jgi:hypothetical protein
VIEKRGSNGRFLPGHCGGPGNPHAQKVHRLRSALLNTVTSTDIEEIVRKLISLAKGGDVAAIKELLDRTIGKPVTAVELTGADGEPLQFVHFQNVIMQALAEFPEARIAVAIRLKELIDAGRDGESSEVVGDGVGSGADDGAAGLRP